MQKVFDRYKDKHYMKFNKIPEAYKWSHTRELCALKLIEQFIIGRDADQVISRVAEDGFYIDLLPEERDRFFNKEDETVRDVVRALLNCGVKARFERLFLEIKPCPIK